MKVKNIIAEAFDLTPLQGAFATLKKTSGEFDQSIQANPDLAKTYASYLTGMNSSVASIDKILANLTAEQKAQLAVAAKQTQVNQQNNTKPGTTTPLATQAVQSANPIPTAAQQPKPVQTIAAQ